MHLRYVLATALVFAIATPALAAEYYVAMGMGADKKCSVSEKKPDGTTMMMVGKASYATKDAAQKAMMAAKECKAGM